MTKIGIIQLHSVPLKVDENIAHAEEYLKRACQEGAELVVLPEWFSVGYSYSEQMLSCAESMQAGKTVTWLSEMARKESIYILTSIYEVDQGDYFNSMVLAQPDGTIQSYRKRNPFWQEYALYEEGGDPGPGIFDTEIGRIGGVVCFDAFARETYENLKSNNVDIVAIVACWGLPGLMFKHPELRSARSALKTLAYQATEELPKRYAEELGVPVIHVGQGGTSETSIPYPKFWPLKSIAHNSGKFWGHSNITTADSRVCKEGIDSSGEFVIVAEVNIKKKSAGAKKIFNEYRSSYLRMRQYFVQPKSFMARMMQQWCARGFKDEYDRRCKLNRISY